jgi:hypothetical protein
MKTPTIALIFVVLYAFIDPVVSIAQQRKTIEKDGKIEVDLLDSNKLLYDFYIEKDSRVQYVIKNFNRNLYNINFNHVQNSFFAQEPPIFKLISEIDVSKIISPKEGKDDRQPRDDREREMQNFQIAKDNISDKIGLFKSHMEAVKSLQRYYQSLGDLQFNGCEKFDSIKKSKITFTQEILAKLGSNDIDKTDETKLFTVLKDISNEKFESASKLYDEIIKAYAKLKESLASIIQINDQVVAAEKKAEIKISLNNEIADEKLYLENLTELIGDIKISHVKITDLESAGFVNSMCKSYSQINESNFTYISPSIRADKDELVITIDIQPKEVFTCNINSAKFNGVYTGSIYGLKMNFSTGIFLISGANIFDQTYRLDSIVGNKSNWKIKQNDNKSRVLPALGALMHIYWKRPAQFGYGGTLGLSINNQTHLNYHLGGSLLFGEKQRLILSLGATLSQVSLIADQCSVDQEVSRSVTSVPVQNFYRWGFFLAITYNINTN